MVGGKWNRGESKSIVLIYKKQSSELVRILEMDMSETTKSLQSAVIVKSGIELLLNMMFFV